MKKRGNIVKKALVGSVIFICVCLSTQAQTAEQLEGYTADRGFDSPDNRLNLRT
jgi:hypothetical protein